MEALISKLNAMGRDIPPVSTSDDAFETHVSGIDTRPVMAFYGRARVPEVCMIHGSSLATGSV